MIYGCEKSVTEKSIEAYLVKHVKKAGGEVRKLQWVNRRGAPDRVVFLRGVHFVELKRPGSILRDEQAREHKRMVQHGANVWTINNYALVDAFLESIK